MTARINELISTGNRIAALPNINTVLFPQEYELLSNTTEVFELEFAFYFQICSNNSPLIWQGRSELTRSYFKEGNFSTGYATHGLFPYRGKFHPQLIKGIGSKNE